MSGEGEHIDTQGIQIHRDLARALHRVRMQIDLPLPGQPANMLQGLDSSDLVVGMHYRNEYGVRTDGPLQVGGLLQPLRIDRQVGYGKALLLQAAAGL